MNENEEYKPRTLWERVCVFYRDSLKTDSEKNQMERHFPQFVSQNEQEGEYVIGVSNAEQAEWFREIYTTPLEHALADAGRPDLKVRFCVDEKNAAVSKAASEIKPEPAAVQNAQNTAAAVQPNAGGAGGFKPPFTSTMPLNENYTFSNFVKGPSNNFAHAIASAVAKDPGGTTNNPFFIWGGTGLGKTHLMQAIGHDVIANFPQKSVCYITSEEFLNNYINALSRNTDKSEAVAEFRKRYRSIDLLLIDDVQFIVGKKLVQEEFFNTYSSLMAYGKQIVMTCDVPPQKLLGLEERLISRFQQGIVIEIELPSYETRMAILKFKTRGCRHEIPECALSYIVENIRSSVRAMEGALNLVERFMDANPGVNLEPETIKELLKNLAEEEGFKRRLCIDEIVKAVCSCYDVTYADMLTSNRSQPLSTARQVAMFLARKLTGISSTTVADHFKRNHSTVLHGMSAIQKRIETEEDLRAAITEITEKLGRKPSELFE